jgi:hypothetical protein
MDLSVEKYLHVCASLPQYHFPVASRRSSTPSGEKLPAASAVRRQAVPAAMLFAAAVRET